MAVTKKTTTRKSTPRSTASKVKATKAASKTAMKAAPAKRTATTTTKRATTASGRLPVNLTMAQAKRIQSKLGKVDTSFKFLDDKIANA